MSHIFLPIDLMVRVPSELCIVILFDSFPIDLFVISVTIDEGYPDCFQIYSISILYTIKVMLFPSYLDLTNIVISINSSPLCYVSWVIVVGLSPVFLS
jgi:hypothetical protein